MPETAARKALGYARISRDLAKQGAGVDRQTEDIRKVAEQRGFELVGTFTDNDITAAGGKTRPGFEAVLEALSAGAADVVIAWAWDRLCRSRRDSLRVIEVGQAAHATVALVRGTDLDMSTASGRLMADVYASFARNEIDAKSERQERAGQQRAEQGRPPGRRAFGYQQDGSVHPTEGPVVTELFAMFLAGSTMVGLQKWLNDNGHTTARGKAWGDTDVRQLLLNPRYIAERVYRGERVAAGNWPALVSAEVFAAVNARLNDPTRKAWQPARKYLGSGQFRCWCGSLTSSSYANGGRVYVCRAQKHMQRIAEPVDEVVRQVIAARLRRPDVAELLSARQPTGVVAGLRAEALALHRRLEALPADYAEGHLTGQQVRAATARLQAKLADVEARLADAGRGTALAAISGGADLGAVWLDLPLDRQRAVLAELVTVTIERGRVGRGRFDPATVTFDWKGATPTPLRVVPDGPP